MAPSLWKKSLKEPAKDAVGFFWYCVFPLKCCLTTNIDKKVKSRGLFKNKTQILKKSGFRVKSTVLKHKINFFFFLKA